jgi:hypothetical protein
MSPVIITLFVLLGVGLLLAIWLMGIYNGLVVAGNRFKNAFAQLLSIHRRRQGCGSAGRASTAPDRSRCPKSICQTEMGSFPSRVICSGWSSSDSPLEGKGFEPVWGFSCQAVFLVCCRFFVRSGKAVLRSVACDGSRSAQKGVKGPKR